MKREEYNQEAPAADASAPDRLKAVEGGGQLPAGEKGDLPRADVAAALPGRGSCGAFRQLLHNMAGGLRISLSLRVGAERFCATPSALALLAATDFLLNLLVSFLLVGRSGSFAYSAVPSFFFHLPLLLLFGLIAGRVLSAPGLLTVVPVALVALSFPVELSHAAIERMAQLPQLEWLADYLVAPHYYRFFWWWTAAALLFLLRLKPASPGRRLALLLLFLILVVLPLWYFPRADLWVNNAEAGESGELHLTEEVLAAQPRLLDAELAALEPGRKGVTDLYFVGFAGDGTQDVFLKELRAAGDLFARRFGTSGRSVLLANNPKSAATLPFASATNLKRVVSRVGEVMNRDEDVLFLYLTSHGSSDHQLVVNNPPLELDDITPEKLSRVLKEARVGYKVVVVSACYAGGFIDPLKDDRTMIITAADADHESFGCGFGEKFTWFGEAFLDHALRNTFSFTSAFQAAQKTIRQWEEEQGETPSNPQIWVGKRMGQKLPALERELEERGARPAKGE